LFCCISSAYQSNTLLTLKEGAFCLRANKISSTGAVLWCYSAGWQFFWHSFAHAHLTLHPPDFRAIRCLIISFLFVKFRLFNQVRRAVP
jgi:hypothetical protein